MRRFLAEADDDGVRLDAFLVGKLADVLPGDRPSRARVQKWIDAGRVMVDGRAAKSGVKLKAGSETSVDVPAPEPIGVEPENIPLEVFFEDPDLIVLMKPAGMATHPGAGRTHGTLVNALLHHCGPSLTGIGDVLRPGIVHRLDMDTSGVMVAAKSGRAHASLSRQFHDHAIDRRYRALATGDVRGELTLTGRLGRDPRDRKKFAVVDAPKGKSAITHVRPLERFTRATLLECALETGRTHQIRVHLSHAGHPIVGDRVYGSGKDAPRQMLHAFRLGFDHPADSRHLLFESPLPADFAAVLGEFRRSA